MPSIRVETGDALDVLRTLGDASVQAVITDPPYGMADLPVRKVSEALSRWLAGETEYTPGGRGFSGHTWDAFVPPPAVWTECLRVLAPGGHLFVFASSRTHDLMGVSVRLAGFEIRDSIAWLSAQRMPKGAALGRQDETFDDWSTTLRSAHDPIIVARKPIESTVLDSMRAHGTGAFNIGATRIAAQNRPLLTERARETETTVYADRVTGSQRAGLTNLGRWPSNVVFTHAPECTEDDCDPQCPVRRLDDEAGIRTSGANPRHRYATPFQTVYGTFNNRLETQPIHRDEDSGYASRFFPTFRYEPITPKRERPVVGGIAHPTPKPLGLMSWLCRLVVAPGEFTILDPFAGSGTTLEAAIGCGASVIGIENNPEYLPLIDVRVARALKSESS